MKKFIFVVLMVMISSSSAFASSSKLEVEVEILESGIASPGVIYGVFDGDFGFVFHIKALVDIEGLRVRVEEKGSSGNTLFSGKKFNLKKGDCYNYAVSFRHPLFTEGISYKYVFSLELISKDYEFRKEYDILLFREL